MNTKDFEENLEKELHVSRYIIAYKFILGVIELILGLGIIFFGTKVFNIYQNFKSQELLEDSHDLLIAVLEKIVPYIAEHRGYVVFLLVALGIVKIIGAIGLLYHKHWALDLLIALTIFLLPFDGYALIINPTLGKFIFFLVNLFIALYLVNFNPKGYFTNLKSRITTSNSSQ